MRISSPDVAIFALLIIIQHCSHQGSLVHNFIWQILIFLNSLFSVLFYFILLLYYSIFNSCQLICLTSRVLILFSVDFEFVAKIWVLCDTSVVIPSTNLLYIWNFVSQLGAKLVTNQFIIQQTLWLDVSLRVMFWILYCFRKATVKCSET